MRDGGLGSWAARRRRDDPDAIALRFGQTTVTYGQLDQRVNRLANALIDHGVVRGDRVACLATNCPMVLELLFAAARVGAVFVPLNTRLAAREIAGQVADCAPALLVHDEDRAALTCDVVGPRVLSSSGLAELVSLAGPDPVDEAISLSDPCVIMYTSGTTGRPKGAVLTHGNLTWNAINVLIDVDLMRDDVALIMTPLFHAAALSMSALPILLKGGTVVLTETTAPEHVLDLIERWSVTHLQGVPTVYQSLVDLPSWHDTDVSSVRRAVSGGAAASAALIERFLDRGIAFTQGYGMTEASPGALYLRPSRAAGKIGSVGRPHFFTDVRVLTPDGEDSDPGTPGELVVQGPNVMAGYWNRDTETRSAFTADGWYRSGDVGVFDSTGDAYVVDRIKDMYISGGENVYPSEVEAVLVEHQAVRECAVIAQPHERWGEVGRAVVVADSPFDPEQMLAYAATRLAKYKIPKSVVVVSELPRNASGKINKALVRARWGAAPAELSGEAVR